MESHGERFGEFATEPDAVGYPRAEERSPDTRPGCESSYSCLPVCEMDFKNDLTKLFSREIDLVEVQTVKNPILKRAIDRDKIILYGREDTKVAV